ncbi:transcriptional regulator [Candidatus Halobonum tyrrellensis]|uniref:Putative transcriptional regulator containing an HTH domain fused to a Zn-ribbon n=1 Tax=Candidatus Halobonum tyrrellensis G22 TaxID=1324957 RepID=V4HNB0_9EURY|nr:transcriptional regulator [Candidatus Halobonum tyrrellensis]ESP89394.1 putative transcriptional regulator containing an HTH domain fused to a Zn-ribbon [Candidatus Halobonum tyrrellensis G22]
MPERTTRQRIADRLRDAPATATDIAADLAVPTPQVYEHLRHVAQSTEEAELLVAPPECEDCGFDGFDDPLNAPSRCPDCKSESIADPVFTIEER